MKPLLLFSIGLVCCCLLGCQSSKNNFSSEEILLKKNQLELLAYFTKQQPQQNLYSIDRQRCHIINSLLPNELSSDTLIIYETLYSNVSSSYSCTIYNSKLGSMRYFTEKSQLRLTLEGIKLDATNNPSDSDIYVINTIKEKGNADWDSLKAPFTGGYRYSLLTIALKDANGVFRLTPHKGVSIPSRFQITD